MPLPFRRIAKTDIPSSKINILAHTDRALLEYAAKTSGAKGSELNRKAILEMDRLLKEIHAKAHAAG